MRKFELDLQRHVDWCTVESALQMEVFLHPFKILNLFNCWTLDADRQNTRTALDRDIILPQKLRLHCLFPYVTITSHVQLLTLLGTPRSIFHKGYGNQPRLSECSIGFDEWQQTASHWFISAPNRISGENSYELVIMIHLFIVSIVVFMKSNAISHK